LAKYNQGVEIMAINVYQIVTDRIIAELEKGSIPWVEKQLLLLRQSC